jgi:hypothetical protein
VFVPEEFKVPHEPSVVLKVHGEGVSHSSMRELARKSRTKPA